jgi:hypothetical protein
MKMSENKVLREISVYKREGRIKLCNEGLNNLLLLNVIRIIKYRRPKCEERVEHTKKERNACSVLVGKHEGKTPLEIPRHRRENDINSRHKEAGWENAECISLSVERDQQQVLNTVI